MLVVAAIATSCTTASPDATSTIPSPTSISPTATSARTSSPTVAGTATLPPPGPQLPRLVAEPATAAPSPRTDPPTQVVVGAVELDLPIVPIGVGADGQLSLPPNPSTVGWYEYGPDTDSGAGSTLLAGHLDSLRYGLGPLVRLRQAGRGDLIVVTTASGRVDRYKVSDVQRVRKADLVGLGVFHRAGSPLLRIVTCGGPFDPSTGYRDNLVVTATPVT